MTPGLNKKDRRQLACIQRSKSARFYAKALIPITAIVFSTAMWSDPVVQPQLQQGLETVRPMIEAAMDGRPINEIIAAGRPAEQALAEPVADAELASLPDSRVPINRPATQPETTSN